MGQIITWFTGGLEKRDINLDYWTYGEGDTYAIDGNDAYQPSDYDEVEERDEGRSNRRFTPPNSLHPKVGIFYLSNETPIRSSSKQRGAAVSVWQSSASPW